MADIISNFFTFTGLAENPPSNLGELLPYLIKLFLSVVFVSNTFGLVGRLTDLFLKMTRFK